MIKKRIVILLFVFLFLIILAKASTFEDKTESDFSEGAFYRTFYNSTAGYLQLNSSNGFLSGNFSSKVFNSGSTSQWNSISWVQGTTYEIGLPNNNSIENTFRGANMSGNILLYHFNETSGTLKDSSGSNNTGTITGIITYGAAGKFANALNFGGSSGRISFAPSSNFSSGNKITIEAWIKWDGESGENFNLQNVVTAGNFRKALRVTEPDHWNGGSQLLSYFNINGIDIDLYSTKKIPIGTWTHIATTYNGTALAIYINGKFEASTAASGQLVANNDNVYIGAESGITSNFDGIIDEVAVYNRSLAADELLARYERGMVFLNLGIRSCDDSLCSGESFTALNASSPQQLDIPNNTYFQYFFNFTSENESASPIIYNVSVDYALLNTAPHISIIFPSNRSAFNYNISIPLNFSVNDNDGNFQDCWYNIDLGANASLVNCQNITFNASEGSHALYVFVNDSNGGTASDNIDFEIDLTKPYINLVYPENTSYGSVQTALNYSVEDLNLQDCWYSINNGQENISINCGQNITNLISDQESNNWVIYANDSAGNLNFSKASFFVDSVAPLIAYGAGTENNDSIKPQNFIFVNVSVTEINEANITFELYNSTSLVNSTTFNEGTRTINWSNLQDGTYYYNVGLSDIIGNSNSTETRTIILDMIFPALAVISPVQNADYSNSTILINISSNGENIFFFNGTENETYTAPVYRVFSEGSNILIAYANDTVGNLNVSNVAFNIDSIAPSLTIVNPLSGSTFGTNLNLELNYLALDTNLESCWYNIDFGANVSIFNCLNTTFNTSAGNHRIGLFSNDSFGNLASASSNFSIQIGAPSISLIDPVGSYFDSGQNIDFVYIATDLDLDACELWGDFGGIFLKSQTDYNVISGTENHFFMNLSDKAYTWNIKCNDSIGNGVFASNESFYVDTINPSLILTQPSGIYLSRSNIPLVYNINDASPLVCYYRIYRGANLEIPNTLINCYAGASSFNVTLDADFVLNLYAEDTVNHITNKNISFSVDTSTPSTPSPPASGGGGGVGGGFSTKRNLTVPPKIAFNQPANLIFKRGTSTTTEIEVTNEEKIFLNECKLIISGPQASWFSNGQSKGLSQGEKFKFILNIKIPEEAEPGDYAPIIAVKCDEGQQSTGLSLTVFRNNFETKITNYEKTVDTLKISYSIREFSQKDHNVNLKYELLNTDEVSIIEGEEAIFIKSNEEKTYLLEFKIPKDIIGEFTLKMLLDDGETSNALAQQVFLQSQSVLGLAISDSNRRTLSIFGIIFLSSITLFFVSRFIYKSYKQHKINEFVKGIEEKHGKRLIKLNVKHTHN